MPATPDGRPDVAVVSLDDGMSTQGRTDTGSDDLADAGMGPNSGGEIAGGSEGDPMGGTTGPRWRRRRSFGRYGGHAWEWHRVLW